MFSSRADVLGVFRKDEPQPFIASASGQDAGIVVEIPSVEHLTPTDVNATSICLACRFGGALCAENHARKTNAGVEDFDSPEFLHSGLGCRRDCS